MDRIVLFGAPQAPAIPVPNNPLEVKPSKIRVVENNQEPNGLHMVLVQTNQDVEQVLRYAQQGNIWGQNNITIAVE